MIKTIEILSYQLLPNSGEIFHSIMQNESVPLHQKWNMDIVYFGSSIHDKDSYVLIRSYDSLSHLEKSQEDLYASFDWKNSLREKIVSKIVISTKIVLELDVKYFNPLIFIG